MLVRKSKFVFLSGVTLGFDFVFMALLAWYTDLFVRTELEGPLQPQFLNVWFLGWGSFLLWFMHHWRSHWSSAKGTHLPLRKTGAI